MERRPISQNIGKYIQNGYYLNTYESFTFHTNSIYSIFEGVLYRRYFDNNEVGFWFTNDRLDTGLHYYLSPEFKYIL